MKRPKKILLGIALLILFICVYAISNMVMDGYMTESRYQILKYKIDDSTENLIAVCNTLIVEQNVGFLDYVDILLTRTDFKDVYNKGDTDLSWDRYNDLLILQAFKCIINSERINGLEEAIINYFPQVKMSEPLAHLSYALGEKPFLSNENKQNILNAIIKLYKSSTGDEHQKYLEYIVAYYHYFNINNNTSQIYIEELNDLVKGMKNYEKKFCYSNIEFAKSCWECMFTGVYNDEIKDYYDFMFWEEVT